MIDSTPVRVGPAKPEGRLDLAICDRGALPIAASEIRRVTRMVLEGEAAEFARDRNSLCYLVLLSAGDGISRPAIVKAPRPGPQRTNLDVTFAGETAILARLPQAGITNAYRLLARAKVGDVHFLLTTHVPGAHPDPSQHPLDTPQLQGIFDTLFAMDCQGLMHYDLKPGNLLLDGKRHGLIDFEFARFESWQDAYAPATTTYCEDFNVSPNLHFPARSNVANFEFRTLAGYLAGLARATSAAGAGEFLRHYLQAKSRYHERMGQFLADLAPEFADGMAKQGGIPVRGVRRRLGEAAAFADRLVALMRNPSKQVAEFEHSLMAFRQCVFERRRGEAQILRVAVFDRLRRDGIGASRLPAEYLAAMARTFDLVWRSSPDPAR
jgi:hypothetical protein